MSPVTVSPASSSTGPDQGLPCCPAGWPYVPLLLGFYWLIYAFDVDLAIRILRPAVVASALLLALVWTKPPLSWAELRLAGIMAVMCAVLLAPSLAATSPSRALADWLKMTILCVVALLLSRALRDNATAEVFGRSLIVASVLAAALTVYVYIRLMGFALPDVLIGAHIEVIALRTPMFR